MRKYLLLFSLFLAFNTHADVVKDVQAFLTSIGDREYFWVYQPRQYATQHEEAFLKAIPYAANGKTLCEMVEERWILFESLLKDKTIKFSGNYALLFLNNSKSFERKNAVQRLAKRYHLKMITFDKSRVSPMNQKALMRFAAGERGDVLLLNPKKRQVVLLTGQHPCLLEQSFFDFFWKNRSQIEEKSQ